MSAAAAELAKVKDLPRLVAIDIYGSPSEILLDHMRRKAQLLGGEGSARTSRRLHQVRAS